MIKDPIYAKMRNKTVASKLRAITCKLMQSFDGEQLMNGQVVD